MAVPTFSQTHIDTALSDVRHPDYAYDGYLAQRDVEPKPGCLGASSALAYLSIVAAWQPSATGISYEGPTESVAERVAKVLKVHLTPGIENCWYGQFPWIQSKTAVALAIAKNTPEIWQHFDATWRNRADWMMRACAVVYNFITNANHSNYRTIDFVHSGGFLPNQRGYAIIMNSVYWYWGSAAEVNSILAGFDFDTYIAQFNSLGFTQLSNQWQTDANTKAMMNGTITSYLGVTVTSDGARKQPYTFRGRMCVSPYNGQRSSGSPDVSYTPWNLFKREEIDYLYGNNIVNEAAITTSQCGTKGALQGTSTYTGERGMCYEFNTQPEGRSYLHYVVFGQQYGIVHWAMMLLMGEWNWQDTDYQDAYQQAWYAGYHFHEEAAVLGWKAGTNGDDCGVVQYGSNYASLGYKYQEWLWDEVFANETQWEAAGDGGGGVNVASDGITLTDSATGSGGSASLDASLAVSYGPASLSDNNQFFTESFTPSSNALLLNAVGLMEKSITSVRNVLLYDTENAYTWTYEQRTDNSGTTPPNYNLTDSSQQLAGAMWSAESGGSPTATQMNYTYSGYKFKGAAAAVAQIVGYDTSDPIEQTAQNSATVAIGDSHSGTVTLSSAPTTGNLLIVFFIAGNDGGGAFGTPYAGSGNTFTSLLSQNGPRVQMYVGYRTVRSGDSSTITCPDLGDDIAHWVAYAAEVNVPSGISITHFVDSSLTDTDSASGATGVAVVGQTTVTDNDVLVVDFDLEEPDLVDVLTVDKDVVSPALATTEQSLPVSVADSDTASVATTITGQSLSAVATDVDSVALVGSVPTRIEGFVASEGALSYQATTAPYLSRQFTLPTYQTSDLLICVEAHKPSYRAASLDLSWDTPGVVVDIAAPFTGTGGSSGVALHVWWKIAASGSETAPTVSYDFPYDVTGLAAVSYRPSSAFTAINVTTGADTEIMSYSGDWDGDTYSATGDATLQATVGDRVVAVNATNDNHSAQMSSPTLTVPGCTLSSLSERLTANLLSTGSDLSLHVHDAEVTAGAATGPPTLTATCYAPDSSGGPVVFLLLKG